MIMFHSFRFLSVIILTSAFAACGTDSNKDSNQSFMDLYGGDPYTGTVQVDIVLPDGSYAATEYGDGSAHFADQGGSEARLVVFGAIEEDAGETGDAGFWTDGIYDEMSWKSDSEDVLLGIGTDGAITGAGTISPQEFRFDGAMSETRFELVAEIEALEETEGGFPAGTTFIFRYNFGRDVEHGGDGNGECNRIVWQPRYVAGFDGSAQTIQVPVCQD